MFDVKFFVDLLNVLKYIAHFKHFYVSLLISSIRPILG